jgi:hypothetical protein
MINGVSGIERPATEEDKKRVPRIEHDDYIWNFIKSKYNNNNDIMEETQFDNEQKELINVYKKRIDDEIQYIQDIECFLEPIWLPLFEKMDLYYIRRNRTKDELVEEALNIVKAYNKFGIHTKYFRKWDKTQKS